MNTSLITQLFNCLHWFPAIHREKNKESEEMFMDIAANMNEPLFRRDFCMLILNLIQVGLIKSAPKVLLFYILINLLTIAGN